MSFFRLGTAIRSYLPHLQWLACSAPSRFSTSSLDKNHLQVTKRINRAALLLVGALTLGTATVHCSPENTAPERDMHTVFHDALRYANQRLEKEGITVFLKHQVPQAPKSASIDPERNLLLGIEIDGVEEPIDIVHLKGPDQTVLKTDAALGTEIVKKVKQHLLAKKTASIFISGSGSKLDTRALKENRVSIDPEGYLNINDHRILALFGKEPTEFHADWLRSYSIMRFVEMDGVVRIFDEYDLLRADKKGMYVDPHKHHGSYLVIQRDQLSDAMKARLQKVLASIPAP